MKKFNFPQDVIPISETLLLDYCWVCKVSRTDYSEFEEHHVVPSHLGGNKGPTVSLCDTCHTKAHKMSEKIWHNQTYIPYKNAEHLRRCYYLAVVICRARLQMDAIGGENKRVKFSTTLTFEEHNLLKKVQKYFGIKNQKDTLIFALKKLSEII